MHEFHAIISGKVQGVFFRAWTRDIADRLALSGWVRNLEDGTVEVLAQGDEAAVKQFQRDLEQGPPLSRVTLIQGNIKTVSSDETLQPGFTIKR